MDRPPDFSEYGEKSLDHLIKVQSKRVQKLLEEQERANTLLFYAIKERTERRTESGYYGTMAR